MAPCSPSWTICNRFRLDFHTLKRYSQIETNECQGGSRYAEIFDKSAVVPCDPCSDIAGTEHGITEYDVLSERAETIAADFEAVSTSIKQMEHRMEQIAALKTHIINYAKTRDTYVAYRKTKAADKPAFHTAHEADLLLHEAAKRAFDAQGVKKLPTVKVLQTEYADLLTKKKAAYEDYKRLRKENQELQAVKSNVDTLLRIEEEHQEKKQEQNR